MATMRVTPGREGYKILFAENTVIMNYKFAAAAAKYGTTENQIMCKIRHDFAGMTEIVVSGRVQTSAKSTARLTYENMESHIRAYSNAEELLEVFETVKGLSKACASPYKYVRDWFQAQFPHYKSAPVFQDGKLVIAPVVPPKVTEYKQKLAG